jgi:arylsulfatase A
MNFRSLFFGVLFAFAAGMLATAAPGKPNVILILADDLGYECIGANGGTSYQTPVLDRLAATGMRFDHCYVQPLCTPTRVQLMTGIYNVRNYLNFGHMDPQAATFGNLFQKAGYATCITGKWQLGKEPALPQKFGFAEHCLWQHTRRPERYRNPGLEINGEEKDWNSDEYGPDLVNDYALDFITRKKAEPFFLYYPMMLTHSPYDPTPDSPDYGAKGKNKKSFKQKGGIDPHFADMVAYMDKLIGKLVARLDELGLRENTLLLFVGDNGTGQGTRSMMGDRLVIGGKGSMTTTGMHVPLIANWPGKVSAGKVTRDLVDSTDFLPTIAEAAGVPFGELKVDGHSFWSQLRGEKGQPREWYYSWYGPREEFVGEFAATQDFKLYRSGEFFDLRSDLAEKQPRKVAQLDGDAAAAAKLLQGALDRFTDARPAALAKPSAKPGKAGAKARADE